MRSPSFLPIAGLVAGLVFLASCTPNADQISSSSYDPMRTAWGTPDIQGIWDFRTLTPLERPPEYADKTVLSAEEAREFREKILQLQDVDNRAAAVTDDVEGAYNTFWWDWGTELNADLRTSLIIDPPDGRLPGITQQAIARLHEQNRLRTPPVRDLFSFSANTAEFRPAGPESLGLSERCLVGFNAGPPLTPSAYNNNLRIVQTPGYVVLVTEMIHDARIIPMDGRPHPPAEVTRWSGDSRGRWEGNTLVIDTTNFTDKTPAFQLPTTLDNLQASAGVGSGKNLHLVERFTPTAEGHLLYEYTVDAPTTFTKPFTVAIPMRATDSQMFEYACHEANYAMPGMLRGARLLESEASDPPAITSSGR